MHAATEDDAQCCHKMGSGPGKRNRLPVTATLGRVVSMGVMIHRNFLATMVAAQHVLHSPQHGFTLGGTATGHLKRVVSARTAQWCAVLYGRTIW